MALEREKMARFYGPLENSHQIRDDRDDRDDRLSTILLIFNILDPNFSNGHNIGILGSFDLFFFKMTMMDSTFMICGV